jgi:hypothetical protein
LQERYNAQKAEDVGKSEGLCAMQRIRVQDLPCPKGSRLPTRIEYMKRLETVNVSRSMTQQ